MAEWNDEYYEHKWKEHIEMVRCWCYVGLVTGAILVGAGIVAGVAALVRWLTGGGC